ncbi:glutathione S-transferase [Dendrothele bispora CBS 962.96]|uniref:glutathione transferase n=1 Tax=Dendrothele bispora (strain CBS 962.96) TaxID=1314807 RepID=A0A4S8LFR3_DENBC|nr:glutathione S-transferase [Dendrothele bispora CBS 962.96]
MVLKLYGNPISIATKHVAVVLHKKKIPYELVAIDFAKIKEPEVWVKQPFGQIPYLDNDGFILYESRAIARYLEAKYPNQGPKLVPSPSDVKVTALFEQAASVEFSDFDPFASKAAYEAIINPVLFGKFLAGDEITLADLFHLSYGELLATGGSDLLSSKGPNVARWWKDVSSRASWQAVKDSIPASL